MIDPARDGGSKGSAGQAGQTLDWFQASSVAFPYGLNSRCGRKRGVKVWGRNPEGRSCCFMGCRGAVSGGSVGAQRARQVGDSAIRPPPGDAKESDAEVLSSGEGLSCRETSGRVRWYLNG